MYGGKYRAGVAVETVFSPVVTYPADSVPRNALNIHVTIGGYLAHNEYESRRGGSFAGNPGVRVFCQNCVEYGVRYLVADFIGMPFGYAFAGEKFVHLKIPFAPKRFVVVRRLTILYTLYFYLSIALICDTIEL